MTLAEFLQLPETKPANEYIDGQIIQKPMPQGKHSVIQGELVPAINGVVNLSVLLARFLNYAAPLGGIQRYLILLFFVGIAFPVMRMGRLLTHLRRRQIGLLKFCLPIKAKPK